MAQVFIHYFSGTGNTKRAVDIITVNLEKNGFQVKRFLMGTECPGVEQNAELQIFAFPVLGWAAPALVKKYFRRLPGGQGTKGAVLAVFGGHPGQALRNMEKFLRRKKFDIFLTGGACYPENWTQMVNPPMLTPQIPY